MLSQSINQSCKYYILTRQLHRHSLMQAVMVFTSKVQFGFD